MKKIILLSVSLLNLQAYGFEGNSDFGSSSVINVNMQNGSALTFQCENGDVVVAKRTSGYQRLISNGRPAIGIMNPTDANLQVFLLTYVDVATSSPYPPYGIACQLTSGSWASTPSRYKIQNANGEWEYPNVRGTILDTSPEAIAERKALRRYQVYGSGASNSRSILDNERQRPIYKNYKGTDILY